MELSMTKVTKALKNSGSWCELTNFPSSMTFITFQDTIILCEIFEIEQSKSC